MSSTFEVDIPNPHSEEWDDIASFDTKQEAVEFCKKHFGADDEGCICLISEIKED